MINPPTHINLILTSTTVGEHWREDYYKSGADPVAYVRDEWMDIETAPKDGTKFLAHFPPEQYGFDDWSVSDCWKCLDKNTWETPWENDVCPTHWRPRPAPPKPNTANK